jgi:hypothetical protein
MFADTHYSVHTPAAGRVVHLFWRVVEAFQPSTSSSLPAELRRLPDHILRDIGVERGDLPPVLDELMTRADMLESRTAVAAWLSATTR